MSLEPLPELLPIPIYQVDAFTENTFGGNPAAICPLNEWLPDSVLMKIAAENNLSETAFFVPEGSGGIHYRLRWFTPTVEVELCGHATLATAYVLFEKLQPSRHEIQFQTRSGKLFAHRRELAQGYEIELVFPRREYRPEVLTDALANRFATALGLRPKAVYSVSDENWIAEYASEPEIRSLKPVADAIIGMGHCMIATAPSENPALSDFVSRYFAPTHGILEDPVTGSAHCSLAPFWGDRLGKRTLRARQISSRQGTLSCEVANSTVKLRGQARLYLEGTIFVPRTELA